MKYGLLWYKKTKNIGDDIQTYASEQFIPKTNYMIDRESISDFKTKNGEPVAVIMNAWWMWKKWNWPPSKYIIPKLISIHMTDWTVLNWGSPIKYELLKGIGKDYLNSYGPVGARDLDTLKTLKRYKIKSYFSGCLTLTLPKQKIIKTKKKYICLVDVDDDIEQYVREKLCNKKIEIKILTHNLNDDNEKLTWKKRRENVEKLLKIYQNSQLVITSRLHVTLPCLAMEVPVLLINDDLQNNRFQPYIKLTHCLTKNEFLNNKYDLLNPLKNKNDYLEIRNNLINEVNAFINEMKNRNDKPLENFILTKYSEEEKIKWQVELMKNTLDKWFYESRNLLAEYNKTIDYLRKVEQENFDIKHSTCWKITRPLRKIKKIIKRIIRRV